MTENTSDRIDVKTAIRAAKTILADLLEGEDYSQLGLEEVKYEERDNRWLVTLGYNRPWDIEKQYTPPSPYNIGASSSTTTKQLRTLKRVKLDGKTGEFIALEE